MGGGPCDFGVSPGPFALDFGTLDFRTSDSGLTILCLRCFDDPIKGFLAFYLGWNTLQSESCLGDCSIPDAACCRVCWSRMGWIFCIRDLVKVKINNK